ncbi:MAG TPA: CBS domain-containing protein, partial [Rhodopila sp.]|nr:CBS domain-containing protein [Rhodopila sp.]
TAADIMTTPVTSVAPEATIAEVASLLASKRISAVPVCNPDGSLAGIVSEANILKPFRESARARPDWWLGAIAEGEEPHWDFLEYLRQDPRTASNVMVRHVIAVERDTPLPRLADLMVRHGVKRLPVLHDGRLVGIVSRSDLIAVVAKTPELYAENARRTTGGRHGKPQAG